MRFCLNNGFLNTGFKCSAQTFEHEIECGKLADVSITNVDCYFLKYSEH